MYTHTRLHTEEGRRDEGFYFERVKSGWWREESLKGRSSLEVRSGRLIDSSINSKTVSLNYLAQKTKTEITERKKDLFSTVSTDDKH